MISGPGQADRTLAANWLQREVARWRYKPGTRLEALTPQHGQFYIRVRMRVFDSRAPRTCGELMGEVGSQDWWAAPMGRPRVTVTTLLPLDPANLPMNTVTFGDWLRAELGGLEDHERDEWLCCDGVLVFDPHANNRQGSPDNESGGSDE